MIARASILIAAAIVAVACGTPRRTETVTGVAMGRDAHLARGKALFDRHCSKCHVDGGPGLGPAINDKPLPRFLMHTQIRVGIGAMPSFKDDEIRDDEVELILDYLKALRRTPPR